MKKYKTSLILNIIIFVLVVTGLTFIMARIKIMGKDIVLAKPGIEAFKYFTVDSNILMGIASIVFAYYDYLVITKKKKEVPNAIYVFKHLTTVSVALTFIVTLLYLAPFSEYEFLAFYRNSNLFFHFLVPIISIIVYIFYESKNQEKKVIIYGMIPMILYSIFYLSYCIINSNSKIKDYDWYRFLHNGIVSGIFSVIIIYLVTYLISYCLWIFNKNNYKK